MLPKKIFTPRCLHTDRDTVFHEDLLNFFNYVIYELSENIDDKDKISNTNEPYIPVNTHNFDKKQNNIITSNIDKSQNILCKLSYKTFKYFWKLKKMSMLHFSKSKEENSKEFYEVLFEKVQYFILYGSGNNLQANAKNNSNCNILYKNDNKHYYHHINLNKIYKILAIYSMYSLYYTQTTEYFYQINTIPEVLFEINKLLKEELHIPILNQESLKMKKEICLMINKLNQDDAFSIGVIIGLKTIILNKYGLPLEQKSNVYRDYVDINNTKKLLDKMKIEEKEKNSNNKNNMDEYVSLKRETVNLMKSINSLSSLGFNGQLYCNYINDKLKSSTSAADFNLPYLNSSDNNMLNIDLTFFPNNMDMLNLNKEDFEKNKITNLDLQFNQIEDNI